MPIGRLDATLWAARAGDEYAFDALWRAENPGVVRYLRVMLGNRAVDDVAAETWAAAVRAMRWIDCEAQWRVAVYRAAHRMATQRRRQATAVPAGAGAGPTAGSGGGPNVLDTIDREAARAESAARDAAVQVLGLLPPAQREPLALVAAGRLSLKDVADVLRRTLPRVRRDALGAAAALHRSGEAVSDGVDLAVLAAVLDGAPAPRNVPVAVLLESVVAALRSPAAISELTGSGPARAAFRHVVLRTTLPPRLPTRTARHRTPLAAALVIGSVGTSGTVLAAYAGVLPSPLQRVAHHLIDAPAPGGSGRPAPDSPRTGPGWPSPIDGTSVPTTSVPTTSAPTHAARGGAAPPTHVPKPVTRPQPEQQTSDPGEPPDGTTTPSHTRTTPTHPVKSPPTSHGSSKPPTPDPSGSNSGHGNAQSAVTR
jgi:RNA polymerase sigma-70 factor (ECF subfamily)